MKTEEVKPFEEGNNLRLVGGQGETQLGAQESIHESQSLLSLAVRATQDHEIIGIAHEAEAGLCQTLVEAVEDDVGEQGTDYSPNNVAKKVIEFLITIPRERLRPKYGDGFRGAPWTSSLPIEKIIGRNQGATQDASGTEEETDAASTSKV
ncbi:MAG TPA: hypothetical protein VJ022_09480 [Anaerolineales bacterium]|nr:hypothetical protein [Anaerolineales bacterium]